MSQKLNKLQRLTTIISEKNPLAVITLRDGQYSHQGRPISEQDKERIEQAHEKTIIINVKIKC